MAVPAPSRAVDLASWNVLYNARGRYGCRARHVNVGMGLDSSCGIVAHEHRWSPVLHFVLDEVKAFLLLCGLPSVPERWNLGHSSTHINRILLHIYGIGKYVFVI
jgi:hypothetical protein